MKQKLIILLILSLALVGNAVADVPPDPTTLTSDTSQSGHVIWSWIAGALGNITDSYNVSVDSVWYNSTTGTSYNDNVGNDATSTIIVFAYNKTGAGNLSTSITGSQKGVLRFNRVTDAIEAIVPIFTTLQDLVVAVVPYILTLAVVGGLIFLIKGLFSKGLNWK